ncbi:hypothetical protein SH2C18_34800 [Clostridium sediminicola]|uniref:hypothetical protein n=1 Tax=Clostridium sediminicola TaxID=3114879 RepID=UPI0031F1CCEF
MKEYTLNVNYIIDDILSVIPTKVIYQQSNKNEIQNIHYEINFENHRFISNASDDTEFAIINLQRVIPPNISIACCQSCRHGNFCPYGDNDNEIFCLKNMIFNNKSEICKIFTEDYDVLRKRSRKLLDFCTDYKPISHNVYYTYNDWGL